MRSAPPRCGRRIDLLLGPLCKHRFRTQGAAQLVCPKGGYRPVMTRWLAVTIAATPGLLLAVLGLFHPAQLTPASAQAWWQLHVVLLPVFPLLGGVLVFLVRGEPGACAWLARAAAYVFATFYTGLDTLAGIGAGLAVATQPGGSPVALDLIVVGDHLGLVGVTGFLLAALTTALVLLRRDGIAAAPGAVLLVGAAVVFLHSHIFWPVGGLAMLAVGIGCGLLAWHGRVIRPRSRVTS